MDRKEQLKQRLQNKKVVQPHKEDKELETIVDEAIEEIQEETPPPFIEENIVENHELKDYLHLIDRNVLKHRKEDFEANKKFGAELKAIHLMLNKRQLLLFIMVFFCGFSIGGTLVYFFDYIAPFLGYALDSVKTASNLIK